MRVNRARVRRYRFNVLDFGPGDAEYKRHFSSESDLERSLALFAPTLHARTVSLLRSAICFGSGRAPGAGSPTALT